ncbi:energy-coupling factor ABC transporter ATP-binding protein [Hyperthermus butylicus]|uniref:ABC transporter n=1 Tax=Hyperthermus butylicus (strain DSM 5456 / JCM 9403 / PLM1-5) TaxID=415426 RepID=A2BJP4_HYPBU|nr:energy-coupling factor ABC transporter ATP-binding protein [Hyperthermus butylicus]ABM80205.1 putative ABC transporter [Hyperthermus butylicus DSM 5456]
MIRVENAWYSYDGRRWALRGAGIRVERGEIVAVVGPNGAGKTTLLKLAGLLLRPQRGTVLVEGRDPWRDGSLVHARRVVVYVHEKPIMLRGTVLDNIAYGLRLRGLSPEEAEREARRAAELLGIAGLLHRRARGLSAGQAQLVALARAVAVKPHYLLLDEPFAHLDPPRRGKLAKLLEELAGEETGIAIASHDTYLLSKIASRVVYVEEGVTREAASLDEAYNS